MDTQNTINANVAAWRYQKKQLACPRCGARPGEDCKPNPVSIHNARIELSVY